MFIDHGESSRKASRPQLNACLDYLRPGDVLLVNSLDRLGNGTHLITLINDFGERSIDLRSLTEPAIEMIATTLGVGTATVKRALKRHADAAGQAAEV